MKAMIEGQIMDIVTLPPNKDGKIVKEARLFQPGEKNLICVKEINGQFKEGEYFTGMCNIYPWAYNGKTGLNIKFIPEGE